MELNFDWDNRATYAVWQNAMLDPEFVMANDIAVSITPDDEKQARAIVFQVPNAPSAPTTPGAALAMTRLLKNYYFDISDQGKRLRTYAVARLLDLAESEKESIALSAVEKIGKMAEVGLFETKISIDVTNISTDELQSNLQNLLKKYLDSSVVAVQ